VVGTLRANERSRHLIPAQGFEKAAACNNHLKCGHKQDAYAAQLILEILLSSRIFVASFKTMAHFVEH